MVSGGLDLYRKGSMKRITTWTAWAGIGLVLAASLVFGVRGIVCCAAQSQCERWVLGAWAFSPVSIIAGFGLFYAMGWLGRRRA